MKTATGAKVIAILISFQVALPAGANAQSVATTMLPSPNGNRYSRDWTPAEQRLGYRNMEKIFPFVVIKRGAKVVPLPDAPTELKLSYTVGHQTWNVDRYMRENNSASVVVLYKGNIILERYAMGFSVDQRWTSFSVAKSITSTLVGAAIEDGAIQSVDDPLTKYLPGLKGSAYDGVTIRNALNMASGVKWNENYKDPNSDVSRIIEEPSMNGSDPIVTYMASLPREATPGTKFVYKSGETDLIGSLLRAATQKPLADYLSEKIWSRYGMEQDAYWLLDRAGHENGDCCISATARDFARFGQFFMHGAKFDGQSIVPDGWIKEATTPTEATRLPKNWGYGFQWWITPGSTYSSGYSAYGIYGQAIFIDPTRDLVAVTLSSWAIPEDPKGEERWHVFTDALQAALPIVP